MWQAAEIGMFRFPGLREKWVALTRSPSDEDLKEQLRKVIAEIARDSREVREFLRDAAK
jgi:hypothetical protein